MTKTKPRQRLSVESTLAVTVSHPLRARCFTALSERTASPAQLARAFDMGDNVKGVEFHVLKLAATGVVEEVHNRPSSFPGKVERFYRACERPLVSDDEWESLPRETRDDFDRHIVMRHLSDVALAFDEGTWGSRLNKWAIRLPMVLDEEGFDEMAEEAEEHYQRQIAIQARAAERIARREAVGADQESIRVSAFAAFFESAYGPSDLRELPNGLGCPNDKEPAAE